MPAPGGGGSLELANLSRVDWVQSSALGAHFRSTTDLAARYSLGTGGLSGHAMGRIELSDPEETEWALNSGVSACFADSVLVVSGGFARSFRRPTFNDLYWPADAFAEGNSELVAESSIEGDITVSLNISDRFRASATGFASMIDEMIAWLPGDDGIWRPENVSRVSRIGLEGSLWFDLGRLEATSSLTLARVTDRTPGSSTCGLLLPYRPEIVCGGAVTYLHPSGVALTLDAHAVGNRFINRSQTADLPPYMLTGAAMSFPLLPSAGLSGGVSVTNMFEEEYEETNGYPGRPRALQLSLTWRER